MSFNHTHHIKMDLNKKSVSGKKTGQTLNFDAKGFRKNMFWNHPMVNFFPGWCHWGLNLGGFQIMFFLNPLASKFKVWPVFFPETDFLFKSILTWCGLPIQWDIVIIWICQLFSKNAEKKTKKKLGIAMSGWPRIKKTPRQNGFKQKVRFRKKKCPNL